MLNKNLKTMRKAKGYTQEELAIKLNVVRQTVCKWEKGLSVPDAEVLSKIADILDTKVSILLGETITDEDDHGVIAEQLAKISEQMAIKNCWDYFINNFTIQYSFGDIWYVGI